MAHCLVLGAGLGGLPAAFELRAALGSGHRVTLVSESDAFHFTPSNPWVLVGWRSAEDVSLPLAKPLSRKGIDLVVGRAAAVDPERNLVRMGDGTGIEYDYLVVATGPKLAFDEVPGLGPAETGGFTLSVCTRDHAVSAHKAYAAFLDAPGPIVLGAAPGASCFGPVYETALIIDTDLRKRRLRNKVPMTIVTSEPYVGHLGLGGVGDSKGMLESKLRERDIRWIANARISSAVGGSVAAQPCGPDGQPIGEEKLPFALAAVIPAFKGVDAVASAPGLCNPRGFVAVDEHQRSKRYPNVFATGVCIAIAPPEPTPVPTGVPKTGYMIESMTTTAVENIAAEARGESAAAKATWNAICLADFGDSGMAFVALPQIPPRNLIWAKEGRWVHLAKIGFEKYFLRKMRRGKSEPAYEKFMLKRLGIARVGEAKG